MSEKGITRRQVILGSAIAGVAGTSAIVHVLRGRYEVSMPSGTGTMKVTQKYYGRDITLDVPLKRPSTPEEKKELEGQIAEQLRRNPTYIEAETELRIEHRDKMRKQATADYAELKKRQLADLAKQPFSKAEKQAAARVIEDRIRTSEARALEHIDKLAADDIARLSKP